METVGLEGAGRRGRRRSSSPARAPERLIFPEAPPPDLVPSCQEAGVLGAVPGVIGLLQAAEMLKLVLDMGETLTGWFLVFDALDTAFTTLEMEQDPDRGVFGDHPAIRELTADGTATVCASRPEPETEDERGAQAGPAGRGA